jgi:hypothetical protein
MEHPASTSVAAPTAWDVIDASRRLSRHLETRLDDALEELAISYAQFEILKLLTRDRNAHAAALARRLRVSRQIASRLLAKLDRGGLVELFPPDGGVRVPIVTRQDGVGSSSPSTRPSPSANGSSNWHPSVEQRSSRSLTTSTTRSAADRPWWLG